MTNRQPAEYAPVSWRLDHSQVQLKVMLWAQSRRAPHVIEVMLSYDEICHLKSRMETEQQMMRQETPLF